jgi:predicted HTH domain antitoxin
MEVTLRIPDEFARRLSADGGDVSRHVLEALVVEGYRTQKLTLFEVSEMLGLSRIETEDFLVRHHIPLSPIGDEDLDREAAIFKAADTLLKVRDSILATLEILADDRLTGRLFKLSTTIDRDVAAGRLLGTAQVFGQ